MPWGGPTCGCHVPWCWPVGCCSFHQQVSHSYVELMDGPSHMGVCELIALDIVGPCRILLDRFGNTRHGVWGPFVIRIPFHHPLSSMMWLCVRASFAGCKLVCLCAQCDWSALDSNASSVVCRGTVPQSGNCRTLRDRAGPCRANFIALKALGAWPRFDLIGQQL